LVDPLAADRVDLATLDAAVAEIERVRRPRIDRDQRAQVRVERATARRMADRSDPRPPWFLRVLAAVPALARWSARRSARALAVPAAVDRIRDGDPRPSPRR
jgi:hypothetical protein